MSLAQILKDPEAFKDGVLVARTFGYVFKPAEAQLEKMKKDFLSRGSYVHPCRRDRERMIERMTAKEDDYGREYITDFKKTSYPCPDTQTHQEKYPVIQGEAWIAPGACASCKHRVPASVYKSRWACALSREQRKTQPVT